MSTKSRKVCDCGNLASVNKSSYQVCARCAAIESKAYGFGRGDRWNQRVRFGLSQACESFHVALDSMSNGRTPRIGNHA